LGGHTIRYQNKRFEAEGRKLRQKIREFVRRDVVTNRERQPENESEMVASSINSLLQRTTTTSVQEIDKLITELQTLSDTLQSERARVQREIVQYSTLTRGALQSTKIIAESLTQFKKAPDVRSHRKGITCPILLSFALHRSIDSIPTYGYAAIRKAAATGATRESSTERTSHRKHPLTS
jgi:hypothetical protein